MPFTLVLLSKFSPITTLWVGLGKNDQTTLHVNLCTNFMVSFMRWATWKIFQQIDVDEVTAPLHKGGSSTSYMHQLASYLVYCYKKN